VIVSKRIPLLRDHHTHPYLYAALANCPDISTVTIKTSALEIIEGCCGGEGIAVVTGWNDSFYGFEAGELDGLPPLVVFNVSLHSLLINTAGREVLDRSFPQLVANHRNSSWVERNAALVLNFLITEKPCDAGQLKSYFRRLAELGVWHAEEMSLKDEGELELFREAHLLDRTRFWTSMPAFESLSGTGRDLVSGIKLFADGALGAQSAWLGEGYLSGTEGVAVYGDEELSGLISRAFTMGKGVAVHAIGDSAVDQAVDVLGRASAGRQGLTETRIEHCQFISRQAARKAKELGIILSMQPNFSLDSICYRDRLPPGYLRRNNPFRMLIDDVGFVAGKDLLFGSDGMPHGVQSALESALFPPMPGQRLTLEEFCAGYCMPDYRNGYIDVSIDCDDGKVAAEVVLN